MDYDDSLALIFKALSNNSILPVCFVCSSPLTMELQLYSASLVKFSSYSVAL